MSDLFGRVKARVRSRSRHRKTASWHPGANTRTFNSNDEMPNGNYASNASSNYDEDDAPAPAPYVARVSLDNTAFHVHSQYGRRIGKIETKISEEQRGREVQALRDMMMNRRNNEDDQSVLQTLVGTMVPDRDSSKRPKSSKSNSQWKANHKRHSNPAVTQTDQPAKLPDNQPRESQESQDSTQQQKQSRPNSNHSRNFSRPITGTAQQGVSQNLSKSREQSQEQSQEPSQALPVRTISSAVHNSHNNLPNEEDKPSRAMSDQHKSVPVNDGTVAHMELYRNQIDIPERSPARDNGLADLNAAREKALADLTGEVQTGSNIHLPDGFSLQNGQKTRVSETWRPAVTHENIIKQRTEIVREEITRTVHIHHYYTLLQPVKVVEILPAKHYMIDPKTGWKIEIPEPEGWVMPESMRPTQTDTSSIKGWTRHYLVNDEHPEGIPESPPLKRELNYSNLRERARSMPQY